MSAAQEAGARWQAAITGPEGMRSIEVLESAVLRHDLHSDKRSWYGALQPVFVDRPVWERVVADAAALFGLLEQASAWLRSHPDAAARYHPLPEGERRRWLAAPVGPAPVGRFDGVGASARFLEYTAPAMGHLGAQVMAQAFLATPAMETLGAALPVAFGRPLERLVSAYTTFAGEHRAIAVVGAGETVGPAGARENLLAHLERVGFVVVRARPDELRLAGGCLRARGVPVGIVWPEDRARLVAQDGPVWEAEAAGVARLVSSSDPMGSKAMWAVLSDPASGWPCGDRATVDRLVPWTRLVAPGLTTGPDGAAIDLHADLLAHQGRRVLKPALGAQGRGVLVGADATPDDWRASVAVAMGGAGTLQQYVAQEMVPLTREAFPYRLRTGVEAKAVYRGLDPFVFFGEVDGGMARLSPARVINVGAHPAASLGVVAVVG